MVFDKLPGMVGRKFKYVQVSRDHRAPELADALRHLCMARVASKVHHTSANGVPLAAEADERRFKCLYMDVGLMCAALHLNVLDLGKQDLTLVNGGAVAEQFVGQHLLYSGPRYEAPVLHYWTREARNAAAEVDYLMAPALQVVPVEIKAGTTGSLRSLHQFLNEKQRDFAFDSTRTYRACCATRKGCPTDQDRLPPVVAASLHGRPGTAVGGRFRTEARRERCGGRAVICRLSAIQGRDGRAIALGSGAFRRCAARHSGTGMIERSPRSMMTLVHRPSMAVRPSGLMIA